MNAILRRKLYAGNPHVNSRAFALLVGVAASLVSWRGVAAGDGTIKVVGGNDILLSTEGVYVEYEFNGKRYRSNECGSGFNASAWKHLSDEDKANIHWGLDPLRPDPLRPENEFMDRMFENV